MTDPREYIRTRKVEDESGKPVRLSTDNGLVRLNFPKSAGVLDMQPEIAVSLATLLIDQAQAINPQVIVPRARYRLEDNGKRIRCLACRAVSSNPRDVVMRYCGNCHVFLY